MEKIERTRDVITESNDLEHLYTFHDFPVFMGCVNTPRTDDIVADMRFWISLGSGMIQLNPLLPLDVLYPEAHGAGCIGSSWAKHHQALADFIEQYNPSSVIEIGGGSGILASKYQNKKQIPWTILEPNPTPIEGCKANIIKGFFDSNFKFQGDVDAVVHSHVFEHIYDPTLFVKQLSDFLEPGKKLIFSVPNMRVMLEKKYINCLNFEHTIYLSDTYVEYLLESNGFSIVEKKYFLDDHSIFYAATKDLSPHAVQLPSTLYNINKELYFAYLDYHKSQVDKINLQLSINEKTEVYLFGAHVQSQYMIGFGLDISKIKCILDNDSNKHGKRLYGTDKLVASPLILKDLNKPLVIVRAGTFTEEIVMQIKEINPTTQFMD